MMNLKTGTVGCLLGALMCIGCNVGEEQGYDYDSGGWISAGDFPDAQETDTGRPEPPKFDVPKYDEEDDGGGNVDPDGNLLSCKKVDFLFVIDNSGSMSDNQANLIANFPVLAQGVQDVLPELESVHLGVVTTDAYQYNAGPCQQLGALVVANEHEWCGPYADGWNFMTAADPLDTAFTCAADVGVKGSGSELAVTATLNALEGFLNSPGQCNEGFSRGDAFTIVVILTDEDMEYNQDPHIAYDHLVWLKGADEHIAVLTLTVLGDQSTCDGYSPDAPDLRYFTSLFTWGFEGDVCAENYGPFLQDAVDVVDTACSELPGAPPQP